MNILFQSSCSLLPNARKWRSRGEIFLADKQKLHPKLQGAFQAISYDNLISLAFKSLKHQGFQENSILHNFYIQECRLLKLELQGFPSIESVRKIVYHLTQLESINWLLTSFFNHFLDVLYVPSSCFYVGYPASEKHTFFDYRHVYIEGV